MHEDSFEVVMRGYSRRQVHDYMIRTRNQIRDLEERLARAIDQAEQGRLELAEARRRLSEAPQDYDELGQRLSQILKLAEEEATAKREVADTEARRLRDEAALETERLVGSARERAEGILSAAQQEAERRVGEATATAEQMLAQAGNDAEETLNAARSEAEETLRSARADAERMITSARQEAERTIEGARAEAEATLAAARNEAESTVSSANAEAHATLTAAQQRVSVLDEGTGRRVAYLTDTHREVMRRLNEMSTVLGDLIHRENSAGSLIDEKAVLPPPASAPAIAAAPQPGPDVEAVRVIVEDDETESVEDVENADAGGTGDAGDVAEEDDATTVTRPALGRHTVASDDNTEVNLGPAREAGEELTARK
ncbi:DivIVA domain-containing protein [Planobispora takensis]|nr:DivIVA domain-containing protein [Planobispora takensis]